MKVRNSETLKYSNNTKDNYYNINILVNDLCPNPSHHRHNSFILRTKTLDDLIKYVQLIRKYH